MLIKREDIDAMPRLRRLSGKRKRLPTIDAPPVVRPMSDEPQQLDVWTERLGSENDAKRMADLAEQYPTATLPELVTMDWLMRNNYQFEFQAPIFGGRRAGGTVADFLIMQGGEALVWSVTGDYWHTLRDVAVRDKAIFMRLLGSRVSGFRISGAVELWESDVYSKRPLIFYQALSGVGLRPR